MASTTGGKRRGRARRWVGALLAVVLLPLGAALLLYSFVLGDDPETNASPPITASPTMFTVPVAPSPVESSSGAPPETTYIIVTSYIAVPPGEPGPEDSDILALATTISGLLASVAGIVSAIVSARAPRRQ